MVNYKEYSIEENEHLYGPGKRLLIFLQGCSLQCHNCVNKELWPFGCGKDISSNEILQLCKDLDGITLHGGEPLDQAQGLLEICKLLKSNNKTIVLFTGYLKKELNDIQRKVWNIADIVISGRYVDSKQNFNLQFRGSTNQRVYTHKGPYKNYKIKDGETAAIFKINTDGSINLRGFKSDSVNELLTYVLDKGTK